MKLESLLIANRGEIAVRIIRAARELGIRTVQVHSTADSESMAVKMADVAVELGAARPAQSYLKMDAILDAARTHRVSAIHPGYGFLAESAEFADAVVDAGFIFVGPGGDIMKKMGDKATARKVASAIGVPVLPGSTGRIRDLAEARDIAKVIGFPLLIKAAAGGGGRGIRLVNSLDEFNLQAPQASAEALAAFGDDGLYLESYIDRARHIEVQVLGDGDTAVHVFERECSLQRRRQKIWEESPSCSISHEVRNRLCADAVRMAESVSYQGAGTVEFLYDDVTGSYYFIEMNTRIQVEHPVSEMVTGIDLVREMICISAGEPLRFTQEDIRCHGCAVEVRINAEDPANRFMPSPGVISEVSLPGGPGVRFDGCIYAGCSVPPFYDSLLGKLIIWDETRTAALDRLRRALRELRIVGVDTTIPLLRALVDDREVRDGTYSTRWLEHWLESGSFEQSEAGADRP